MSIISIDATLRARAHLADSIVEERDEALVRARARSFRQATVVDLRILRHPA
jgi:hypothetical protein